MVHTPSSNIQHSSAFALPAECAESRAQSAFPCRALLMFFFNFYETRSFDVDMTGTGCSLPVKPGQWLSGLTRKECQDEEEGRQ